MKQVTTHSSGDSIGELVLLSDMQFKDELRDYENHLRRMNSSASTIKARTVFAARFLLEVAPTGLAMVTPDRLAAFLADPSFSSATRSTYYSHLRCLYRWAVASGRSSSDPTASVRRPRQPKGRPRPITPEQVRLVLGRADGDLHSWLILSMFAGLRAHEIAKIRGDDVTEQSIFVIGKGGTRAYVPTHPLVWTLAQMYPTKGYWFPSKRNTSGHVQSASITRAVSKLFRKYGIEGSSHRGRHVYGTSLLRSGANLRIVQECMRHASPSTTAIYTQVDEDEMRAAVLALSA